MHHCPCSVKRISTTRGISGYVCHIYLSIFFCGYTNHDGVSYTVRANHGNECDFAADYTYANYIWQSFLLSRNG
jgi:hypothetical protein